MTKRRNRGQRNQGGAPTEAAKVYASGAPRKRSLRAKLLLSAVAVVMTLLVAEIAFRTYYFFVGSPTHITFGATSEEWRRLWIERHQNKGVDIYHGYNRYDPRLGWALKPDLQAYKVGDYPAVTTNSQGWRADRDFPVAKPENTTRIVAVGDSLTFGEGVANQDTWPAQLEIQLDQSEVFNLAIGGYGTDQQLLVLEEAGLAYAPDIVIVGFFVEDVMRNGLAFRDYAKPRFVLEDGRLRLTNMPIPTFAEILGEDTEAKPWSYLAYFVGSRLRGRFTALDDLANNEDLLMLSKALLTRMQASAHGAGAKLLVVAMPSPRWPKDTELALASWAPEIGYAFMNLRKSLIAGQAEHKKSMLLDQVHMGPLGNLVAAIAVREKLEALGWIAPLSDPARFRLNRRIQDHK